MTLEELKELVRNLIQRAQTNRAIDEIIQWAKSENHSQLTNEIIILEEKQSSLDREKRLGLLSSSEASRTQSRITVGVLDTLDNVKKEVLLQGDDVASPTRNGSDDNASSEVLKILMLTANPGNKTKLNLDKEYTNIGQNLQDKQDLFNIILKKAVSASEFQEFTYLHSPDILHFSGHGEGGEYAGIVVQNEDGDGEDLIDKVGLAALFEYFKMSFNIKAVILNACHTQDQAATISKYVEYVIGTNVDIKDNIAIAFSRGFYFHLATDNEINIAGAYYSGRAAAVVRGGDKENFVIYKNGELLDTT